MRATFQNPCGRGVLRRRNVVIPKPIGKPGRFRWRVFFALLQTARTDDQFSISLEQDTPGTLGLVFTEVIERVFLRCDSSVR